jgi:hypothetical protein
MKIWKIALLGLGVLAACVVLALAYLVITFDARDYAPWLVRYVKANTGRSLDIAGPIELSIWPRVSISLRSVSLSEHESGARFAHAETVSLRAELLPLLSRELVVNELRVSGAEVHIVRHADGHLNIQDLLRTQGSSQFDIGAIVIERSSVSYADLGAHARYELSNIYVQTGRIKDRSPTSIKVGFELKDADRRFAGRVALAGELRQDAAQGIYGLDRVAFDAAGRLGDGPEITTIGSVALEVHTQRAEFAATDLVVRAKGLIAGEALDATLKIARVAGRAAGESVVDDAKLRLNKNGIDLRLETPRIRIEKNVLNADNVESELQLQRGADRFIVKTRAQLNAHLAERSADLSALESTLTARGETFTQAGVSGALSGRAVVDLMKEYVLLELAGVFDASRIKGHVTVAGLAAPAVTISADLDRLTLDRYLQKPTQPRRDQDSGFDLASLEALPASGRLQIGVLELRGVRVRDVSVVLKP